MKLVCFVILCLCSFAGFVQAQETSVAEQRIIYVIGAVVKPAEIRLEQGMTLLEAIAIVGGLSKNSDKFAKIYRRISGATIPEAIKVNLKEIKAGKAEDLMLQPFDIIEISSRKRSKIICVFPDYGL